MQLFATRHWRTSVSLTSVSFLSRLFAPGLLRPVCRRFYPSLWRTFCHRAPWPVEVVTRVRAPQVWPQVPAWLRGQVQGQVWGAPHAMVPAGQALIAHRVRVVAGLVDVHSTRSQPGVTSARVALAAAPLRAGAAQLELAPAQALWRVAPSVGCRVSALAAQEPGLAG